MEDFETGKKIKTIRQERGLSIQELARKSGLAPSFISQVERGINSLSVASLKKILLALNTNLSRFFHEDNSRKPESPVYRAKEMKNISTGNKHLKLFELAPNYPERKLQMLKEVYEPGADTGPGLYKHDAEEAFLCVRGSVEITIGEEKYTLEEGDGAYFDSNIPHRVRNLSKEKAVLVSVNTPPSF